MATPSDELFCRARIVGDGTVPPVHSMGGVRSSFDPSSTAVALAASCLARLGYRGGNPALGLPADPTGKLAAGTCWGHRLSGWISPPLFGRAGLSRCPARPADRLRRRGLPINLGIYIARFGVGTLPADKSDNPAKTGVRWCARKLASSYVVIWRALEPVVLAPIFSHERLLAPP